MGRYFLGVGVPAAVCGDALVAVTKRLEPMLQVKRWYTPEQFHLTTHFLGDLDDAAVQRVKELVAPHTGKMQPFSLRLSQLGWFPNAKVVWCGCAGDTEALQRLYGELAGPLQEVGAERYAYDKFRAHITLGRLKEVDRSFRPETVDVSDLLTDKEWQVTALHLYESVSTRDGSGPAYPVRERFVLGE